MNINRVYEAGIVFLFVAFSFHLAYAGEFVIYGGEQGTQTVKTPDSTQPSVGKTETSKRQQEEQDALERRRQQIETERIRAEREKMAIEIKERINNAEPSRGFTVNSDGVVIPLPPR
jgi:hypothetical protein